MEIDSLYRRFVRLDKDDSGAISMAEFMAIPELAMNPLSKRIVDILTVDGTEAGRAPSGEVSFTDFVRALSVFHPNASRQDKLKCLTYDFRYHLMSSRIPSV